MLTIWGRSDSSNVKKVLWCAEELGLAYRHIPAGGPHGVVNDPPYRALNPNGLVPTIEDEDLVLWESNAIVRYLAARYGNGVLWQDDPARRAPGDRWMDWTSTSFAPPYRDVFWNLVRTAPEKRDMAAVEAGVARCGALLDLVEPYLARQPYLSGEAIGPGDIPLGVLVYGLFELKVAPAGLPHVEAWYQRLRERPAYRKVVTIPLT